MKQVNNVMYCIRARDRLDADPENTILLYGTENQFMFMVDLCRWLTILAPQRLVEFIYYAYGEEGIASEIHFGGEELSLDDCGTYFKIEGNKRYVLKDSPEGIVWDYVGEELE